MKQEVAKQCLSSNCEAVVKHGGVYPALTLGPWARYYFFKETRAYSSAAKRRSPGGLGISITPIDSSPAGTDDMET
jgi:hypothetical protein